ncbi:hypothetical protein MW871_14070 [Flavobacterium sp. I-SCBP12n]|uniref:Uncharacterized protein n=1 Tax=Flavobacterium pygoscelis TaxID=2893176 RepID=A0A9X2BR14_9FLAO|nr:hypothetical protein [Flavobacterium pygoscelis]MCK8143021.1 hypothetical protein [Flavobacterium pygoscelis]
MPHERIRAVAGDPLTSAITYDIKYIDAKYLPDSPFSSNQTEIVNEVKNNGVANCKTTIKPIVSVNDIELIPANENFHIKSVQKLTIDNLMNLVIQ